MHGARRPWVDRNPRAPECGRGNITNRLSRRPRNKIAGQDSRGDSEMTIRVFLADDHELVRQGLKALLEREGFQVVGEASNGQEALRLVPDARPDVAVLDISMP